MKNNSNLIDKNKIKNNVLNNYIPVKINVKLTQFWIIFTGILIHTILLMILFIYTIFDNNQKRLDPDISNEQLKKLESIFIKIVISYVINNFINFIFIIYSFLAIKKIKIGYLFTIIWFMVWLLIAIGSFFIFIKIIVILVINLIACLFVSSVLIWFFYDLYYRSQEIKYEKIKKRKLL